MVCLADQLSGWVFTQMNRQLISWSSWLGWKLGHRVNCQLLPEIRYRFFYGLLGRGVRVWSHSVRRACDNAIRQWDCAEESAVESLGQIWTHNLLTGTPANLISHGQGTLLGSMRCKCLNVPHADSQLHWGISRSAGVEETCWIGFVDMNIHCCRAEELVTSQIILLAVALHIASFLAFHCHPSLSPMPKARDK